MNLQKTEKIKLKDSKTAFAFGLTCQDDTKTKKIRELFDLKLDFMNQTFFNETSKKTIPTGIKMHKCKEVDFYNLHNESFKSLKIEDLQCIEQSELKIINLKVYMQIRNLLIIDLLSLQKIKVKLYSKKLIIFYFKMIANFNSIIRIYLQIYQILKSL